MQGERCRIDNVGAPQCTTLEPPSRAEVAVRRFVARIPEADAARSQPMCGLDVATSKTRDEPRGRSQSALELPA